jgi:hypothetical protein
VIFALKWLDPSGSGCLKMMFVIVKRLSLMIILNSIDFHLNWIFQKNNCLTICSDIYGG